MPNSAAPALNLWKRHLGVVPDYVWQQTDLETLILGVQRVARAVRSALQPDGLIITQFNGAPAGQTVFHLHFHISPRWEHVALAGLGAAPMADAAELAALAKEIKAMIA